MSESVFRENVVVITGASSGIGRELAYQLADQGAWLALGARRVDRLEAVAEECRQRGGRVITVPTDVGEESQCQTLIRRTVEEYGRINTLVNNAGTTMWAMFEDMQTLVPFDDVMRVNYLGSVYCTYFALPYLKESAGRIVAVSSVAGLTGVPTRSGYVASKHAMAGFFDTLRIELAGYGVSVTMVHPDFVQTETRMKAAGPDGKPIERSPVRESKVMTAEACVRILLKAAARRQRRVLMSSRSKVLIWVKLIAPGLVDRIARRAIERGR